ncbi:hypothetical protein M409DRAFT_63731 [Zasmidium cellare ATCC 36951]|uniref:Carboxypeptidase n=1 Tax=Zasmidium cellare ATCC 36951 TaxID=1080233 RepID=A0A6A6CWS3_ZASCE|nr:uncharacterized protein M409DRAFT_63731 [Zasmidium cellare ATCC 36951]KAF2171475.1 hypothetical protein M409DRAFT_63731 [Zasmidium cellare ATCC 36951]
MSCERENARFSRILCIFQGNGSYEIRLKSLLDPENRRFAVHGNSVPDVDFDIGESYAGLLPISSIPHDTRKLFFWFFPSITLDAPHEVLSWFRGGPGCSSLGGFISENGPFTWLPGTYKPVRNAYDWRNLTNVLWAEEPVGFGFTEGASDITNEEELAKQYIGFYKQFLDTFDLRGWDVYLSGESYAGYYVTYVANEFIDTNSPDMPLKGIALNGALIGDGTLQLAMPIQPFVEYWWNVLGLNDTFRKAFAEKQDQCGYSAYLDMYLKFPAPQRLFSSPVYTSETNDGSCNTHDVAEAALFEVNPCFNAYHATDYCPRPWTVLGPINDDFDPAPRAIYFNRQDVKRAIHAPLGRNWTACASTPSKTQSVFQGPNHNETGEDQSLPPGQTDVLQRVIEHTNNVIIGSGGLGFLVPMNGTLLFYVPSLPVYNLGSVAGSGLLGTWGTERGLTFYEVHLAGHEMRQYAPGAAFHAIELLLGRIDNLDDREGFTTVDGGGSFLSAGMGMSAIETVSILSLKCTPMMSQYLNDT